MCVISSATKRLLPYVDLNVFVSHHCSCRESNSIFLLVEGKSLDSVHETLQRKKAEIF